MSNITVGISAYNEERSIAASIKSALESIPAPLEVIVVASGCTDNTEGVVRGIMRKERKVKLISEKVRRGKGSAINLILKHAKGGFIVMTDADLAFPPHSIKELMKKFGKKIGAVSGRPEYSADSAMFNWWGKFASECANRQRFVREKEGFHAISGYLYAVRKGIVKGIPASAKSEDAYVGEMVKQKGYGIGYAPEAVVYVGYAENYLDYLTQKVRTHFGHLEVFERAGAKSAVESARMAGGIRGEIKEYFKVAAKRIRNPSEFIYFVLYLITEVMVWCMAFLKYYLKGKEEWKQIKSTKKRAFK
ncbi:MAG: glycosyltransferase [Candidatus Micrarchaeota archaeon]